VRQGLRMSTLTPTERTQIRRIPKRGSYEREVMNAILDEALVCHVGFVHRDMPFVIPTTFARMGERIFVHGAAASRMLGAISDHALCVTVTLVDGLVLARSAFHHSMNYRSVVLMGRGRDVTLREEKLEALTAFIEKISPNRSSEVRAPNDKELAATRVITLDLTEASAKIRTGGPVDDEEDRGRECWAGHVPLKLTSQEPVRDGAGDILAPKLAAHFR
jgi:nitroimidazol reductase NimA-like FMN-containing flavoprotein (pyridoxamine 5'-phosphate oxidase superfamily)